MLLAKLGRGWSTLESGRAGGQPPVRICPERSFGYGCRRRTSDRTSGHL